MFHVIRAAKAITNCHSILVIGSQAVLGHCLSKNFNFSFNDSMEIDIVAMPELPALNFCDLLDGSIGEESMFHHTFGYYGHGVKSKTAKFPPCWNHRILTIQVPGSGEDPYSVFFPSTEDLVLSKYLAGRDKDREFVRKVIAEDMVDQEKLFKLLALYPPEILDAESMMRTRQALESDLLLHGEKSKLASGEHPNAF